MMTSLRLKILEGLELQPDSGGCWEYHERRLGAHPLLLSGLRACAPWPFGALLAWPRQLLTFLASLQFERGWHCDQVVHCLLELLNDGRLARLNGSALCVQVLLGACRKHPRHAPGMLRALSGLQVDLNDLCEVAVKLVALPGPIQIL